MTARGNDGAEGAGEKVVRLTFQRGTTPTTHERSTVWWDPSIEGYPAALNKGSISSHEAGLIDRVTGIRRAAFDE